MVRRAIALLVFAALLTGIARAAQTGWLKLEVLNGKITDAQPAAEVFASGGRKVGEVAAGGRIALPTGSYKLVLPIAGGAIVRDHLLVESGRVHTVLVNDVAALSVSALGTDGKDRGFDVTVSGADPPHRELGRFLTGSTRLFAPGAVNIAVDAPPQGYFWHAVGLKPGEHAELTLQEELPAELTVKTTLARQPLDKDTRVIIYKAGTQRQVAVSPPGPIHRLTLEPGDYDIYVQNQSGRGRPYVMDRQVHLSSGAKVEHHIALDTEASANGN